MGHTAVEIPAGAGQLDSLVDGLQTLAASDVLHPQGAVEEHQVIKASADVSAQLQCIQVAASLVLLP